MGASSAALILVCTASTWSIHGRSRVQGHRARQRGRGVRCDELPRLVVAAGVCQSACAHATPFSTSGISRASRQAA